MFDLNFYPFWKIYFNWQKTKKYIKAKVQI